MGLRYSLYCRGTYDKYWKEFKQSDYLLIALFWMFVCSIKYDIVEMRKVDV